MLPLKHLRMARQAASTTLFAATAAWEEDPSNLKLADKVNKARREWEHTNDEYERARRRHEWTRARRIIALAAQGRGQKQAQQFQYAGFRHVK